MTGSKQYVGHSLLRGLRLVPYALLNRIDAGLILAALLTLLIIQSLWRPGLPAAADIPIHLYRTMEYGRAWSSDVIIPRWAPNLAYGYGYPLFIFAPPLPYLLGLALHTLGLSVAAALKTLIILIIPLYAIGMYLLVRDLLASVEAGLVAATAYAFAPFALREALLYGGNIPQFLAIGLFPWTLWALTRAVTARSWGWALLSALVYAGIVLSHLFHALIFTPVVGLFGLLLWLNSRNMWNSSKFKISSTLASASSHPSPPAPPLLRSPTDLLPWLTIPLGLLLSAFFWIPAFVERFYTRALADAYLEKSPFFVRYPHWTELLAWIEPLDGRAANPEVPLSLGLVTLGLAAVGLVAGIVSKYSTRRNEEPFPNFQLPLFPFGTTLFFGLIAATAIFLTLPLSQPVWETIPLLQVAEFPWRMLGLTNLGLAFLAGAALLLPPSRLRRPLMIGCTLLLLFSVAPLLFPVTAFTRYGQPTIADQIQYERSSQSVGTTTLSEYLPRTVDQPPSTSQLVETYRANQIPERLDRDSLPAGASATLLEQTAVTHRYRLTSPTAFNLRLYQFDYPGWRARLDGQPVAVRPQSQTGLILIDMPAGQHVLTVSFGETPLRVAAMLLSGLTVIGLIAAGLVRYGQSGRHQISRVGDASTRGSPPRLPVRSPLALLGLPLIVVGAIWLKPLLRPIFTIESPPGQALPAQNQTQIDFSPFGQEKNIRLIGYDLSRQVVPPGGYVQVTLYWQTDAAPLKANLQPFVHLDRLDDFTTIADATNYTPGDVTTESVLPTFHWDNARYIRDEHDLHLSPDTAPMAYAVRIGLIDPDRAGRLLPLADGSGDTAQLAHINVSPAAAPPRLAGQLDIPFSINGDLIRLTGFELDSLGPDRLNFRLAWQTGRPLQTNYTIFAQLLDNDQNLVASFDSPPLGGAYPTSTWLPDQTIIDPRQIPLDGVEPGEYNLIVGLYESETQARLRTPTGMDFVELTSVSIKQP